jgi:hypothetical protein
VANRILRVDSSIGILKILELIAGMEIDAKSDKFDQYSNDTNNTNINTKIIIILNSNDENKYKNINSNNNNSKNRNNIYDYKDHFE